MAAINANAFKCQEDKYWILVDQRDQIFDNPYVKSGEVHIVKAVDTTFDLWRRSPALLKTLKEHRVADRWVGRRVNDEVELFDDEDDEVRFVCTIKLFE